MITRKIQKIRKIQPAPKVGTITRSAARNVAKVVRKSKLTQKQIKQKAVKRKKKEGVDGITILSALVLLAVLIFLAVHPFP